MTRACRPGWLFTGMLLLLSSFATPTQAGGSGLNTLVVINQNSPDSVELGNYYAERRQIPPEHVVRIAWAGGNTYWDVTQFQTNLLQPVLQTIAERGLSNQIHYVVLAMDIPFGTVDSGAYNSTTAALFYGLKGQPGTAGSLQTNSYYASEQYFPEARPATAPGYSFLCTMLTAGSLAQAKTLVDQGVQSDETFPSAPVWLMKTSDPLRRLRYVGFDHAIFNTRLARNYSLQRTNSDQVSGFSGLLGLQTGLPNFSVSPNTFVPGALADSMTSFGGVIFGGNDQTSLLAFIHAGAAGSYGTVVEPSANAAKFPHAQVYFYQARGFSLAECYYQSLDVPFQGLIVGEPLAAPFARRGTGQWLGITPGATLTGSVPLTVAFMAADRTRPLQRVDLFVNGKFHQTLTNLPPTAGNAIRIRVNGQTISHVVPANATLSTLASGLAATLNSPAVSNLTRTLALPMGDRVELRQLNYYRPAPPAAARTTATPVPVVPALDGPLHDTTAGSAAVNTTFIRAADPTFLPSTAAGIRTFAVSGTVQVGTWLRLTVVKTNGITVTVTHTNQAQNASAGIMLGQLANLINATPELQGPDGVGAEDFTIPTLGLPWINVLARSPGWAAAQVQVSVSSSGSIVGLPGGLKPLTENLSDLQPRNHLYLTAGATQLPVTFTLNTTTLPDGFHELTAVAYEGSSVATQTQTPIPVRVQNTPLTATLTSSELLTTNSSSGNYSLQVTTNTNNVTRITLHSTGGPLATATNQSTAAFNLSGSQLGVGRHTVYATVETAAGLRYRTAALNFRLVAP